MSTEMLSHIKPLIILENIFCINRSFIINDGRTNTICNIISITMLIIISGITIWDIFSTSMALGIRTFQSLLGFEFIVLVLGARFNKINFDCMKRLGENCSISEENISQIKLNSLKIIFIAWLSLIFDFIGMEILLNNMSVAMFLSVMFGAHDTEMALFSILVNYINIRLPGLGSASPSVGSRVYRHVLIATSKLSEQYTPRVFLMLGITFITTIIYALVLFLADTKTDTYLWMYLFWREAKSLHSLWIVCTAVAKTHNLCEQLAFQLAGRLVMDQRINKDRNRTQYKAARRWYITVQNQRPSYISGSITSISLCTPLELIDLSINYMLIIIQIYIAYH